MPANDIILAVLLLTTPPGTTEVPPTEDRWPAIRAAVQHVAIEWEILDSRETSYIMAKLSDFDTDINLLRRRHVEFADAPKLAESYRLPERAMVNEMVLFNRAYRRHLVERHSLEQDRAEMLQLVMLETDRLYKVWDAVRDAKCDFYYVTVRRQAMKQLKKMVGEEDYYSLNLPPNVPTWRYNDHD